MRKQHPHHQRCRICLLMRVGAALTALAVTMTVVITASAGLSSDAYTRQRPETPIVVEIGDP